MAYRSFLQAKLHGATITSAEVEYEGSIAVCPKLLEVSGLLPNERVDVYNLDNGERLTTYIIQGDPGEVCLNGAAAHKGRPGQRVIIASYTWLSGEEMQKHTPRVVLLGPDNTVDRIKE